MADLIFRAKPSHRLAWILPAWDLSLSAKIAIGAAKENSREAYTKWKPIFAAFEAGAWLVYPVTNSIYVATLPTSIHVDEKKTYAPPSSGRILGCITGMACRCQNM